MTIRFFRQFFVLQYRRTHIAVPCLLRISKKTKVGTYRVVGIQLVAGIQAEVHGFDNIYLSYLTFLVPRLVKISLLL